MTFDLTAMRKAKEGATKGRRVQFSGKYCQEAKGTSPTSWDSSHDTSVIRPDGARMKGYAHHKHADDATLDAMAPDMADEIERLTAALATARDDALRDAAAHLAKCAEATPVGHENPSRGASTYNWLTHHSRLILALIEQEKNQ